MRVQPKQRKALAAPGIVLRFCRFYIVRGSGCLRLAVSSAVKLTGRLDSHCESMLYPRCLRCLGILHLAMLHRHRAACVSSPMPVWSTWGLFPRQDPAAEALCPRLLPGYLAVPGLRNPHPRQYIQQQLSSQPYLSWSALFCCIVSLRSSSLTMETDVQSSH